MSRDFFVDIDLNNGAKNETAVCIPDGYKPTDKINLIIYLHGTGQKSIRDYLGQSDHNIRPELDGPPDPANKKNRLAAKPVILIAPTLTGDARGGKLGGDDADTPPTDILSWYVPLVSDKVQAQKPNPAVPEFKDPAKIGKVILCAHSGGGKVMLGLARTKGGKDGFANKIVECWGIDCLYGQPPIKGKDNKPLPGSEWEDTPDPGDPETAWTAWKTKHYAVRELLWANWLLAKIPGPGVEFYLDWTDEGHTSARSTNLEKLVKKYSISNAHIKFRKGLSHDGAVKVVFGERLGALTV